MFSSFQGQHTRGDIGDSYLLILRYRNREIARNTRSCQKVAEQQQQQHKLYLHDYNYVVTVLQ